MEKTGGSPYKAMSTDLFHPSHRRRLILRTGRDRAIANRHPWIFSGAIAGDEGPDDAAIADLYDAQGKERIASGLYSAFSQIRLRALTFGSIGLTQELLEQRIGEAISRRRVILDGQTSAARLIHSEGDDLSGLVVDQYGSTLVVEITSAGLERLRPVVIAAIRTAVPVERIYLRNDLPARQLEKLSLENEWLEGEPGDVVIREHGLEYLVSPELGQKTGFFLDQRENRQLARSMSGGRRVLNLFSYSGAFGVNAASGGATSVEEVDTSAAAIDLARENHRRNGSSVATFVTADAFQHTRALLASGQRYGLVVCDPPAFAKSAREVDRAARGYKDINLQAIKLVEPEGLLQTFSCSGHMSLDLFQKVVFAAATDAGRRVSFIKRLGAGTDHPVSLFCPEGEYLKGFLLRVS